MSEHSSEIPDELDILPRQPREVARRAVALATLARRGVLEVDGETDAYARETDRFDLASWARSELADTLTDREARILAAPIGELGEDDLADCDDALVAAAALAWALGVAPVERLPVPDDGEAEEAVLDWAPQPWAALDTLARRLELRPEETLANERERWELWYWRANEAEPGEDGFEEVIAAVRDAGLIPTAGGDLATDAARPFGELAPDAQAEIAWLAERRVRALNWVTGFGEDWDSAPVYPD